jgi:hypothetical protein
MDFTPEQLLYQHLTLDAAHWALTSTVLQHLVSSDIRQSAKEQLICLHHPSSIPACPKTQRTSSAHRTPPLPAGTVRHIVATCYCVLSASGADSNQSAQLCATLSSLDFHAQDLLHAAAHRAQLAAATDTHRASTLAVALRKLNTSNLYEDDTSSNVLQDISCAEVIDMTGKAVAAQPPLTIIGTDPHSCPHRPPSSYSARFLSSAICRVRHLG